MSDIVDRLRARAGEYGDMAQDAPEISQLVPVYSMSLEAAAAAMDEAADEIERLRARVRELETEHRMFNGQKER